MGNKNNLILIIPFILIILITFSFFNSEESNIQQKYEKIQFRSFDLKLTQRGTLEASRFVQIKSSILSNRAKIVELIPEGTKVSKGQIIARFDTKPFIDDMTKWKYKLEEAKATQIKVQKELEIHKSKSNENIEKLKKSIEVAKIKLQDIRLGEGTVKLNEYKQKIYQEQRNVALKEEELSDYESLFTKGYISKRERDQVQNDLLNTKEALNTAQEKLMTYEKYSWPKQVKEQEITLKDLEEEFINIQAQDKLMLDNKIAQVEKAFSIIEYTKNEYKKAKKNVAACDIKAPIDGIVLYNYFHKNGKKEKVNIGDSIWQNQSFMQIPDTKNMIVKTKIREIDLNKVTDGTTVNIELDAFPNKVFKGSFNYIDIVAKTNNNVKDIKFFDAIITVNKSENILRSGMSANIDIIYNKVNNQLSVHNDAINYDGQSEYVKVVDGDTIEKRYIKIGKTGEIYSVVLDGLQENEIVVVK